MSTFFRFVGVRIVIIGCLTFFLTADTFGQMWNGQDTLYGNEWIDYDQSYHKILVAEDGVYRISGADLANFLPPGGVTAGQLQLFHRGEEVPLYINTAGTFGTSDYLEFIGRRNRTEVDRYLFADTADIFHPELSFFTDTSAYFLTWSDQPNGLRFDPQANDLTNLPNPEPWFMHTQHFQFTGDRIKKSIKIGSASVQQSFFSDAEGYCDGFDNNTLKTLTVTPGSFSASGPDAEMTVRIACRHGSHHQLVRINGTVYVEDEFNGYQGRTHTFELPLSELSAEMDVEFEGIYDNNDKQAVSAISLRYPHSPDLEDQSQFFFRLPASNDVIYLEFSNFSSGGQPPILYNLTQAWRLITTLENGTVRIAVPPAAQARDLVLIAPSAVQENPPQQPANFVDYSQQDAQFILIYNPVISTDGSGTDHVAAYADYRANNPHNVWTTATVDIQQLYDQYAYGLQRHPIAIRNFGHWMRKNWTDPRYVMLIGKGREYRDVRFSNQVDNAVHQTFFIPTFGVPGSDNLLLSDNNSARPVIPIGRLAVTNADQIRIYLEKVQAFEEAVANAPLSIEGRQWMKRVMHLGGGGSAAEQTNIKAHLRGMESIIESSRLGADVTSFYKTSTDPVENSQSNALKALINDGVAILTFFGHSSPNTFDFNFDTPNSYDNTDRYPVMMSFGCFSGQCHQEPASIGETFVLAEDRGSIAFFASVGYGFISSLDRFGDNFYNQIGNEMYGNGIGDVHQRVIADMQVSTIVGDKELSQQSTLQGDPSLRLYPLPGPDYIFDGSSVQLDPPFLNVQEDSFDLSFTIRNLGFHWPDTTFALEIQQELPDGQSVELVDSLVAAPAFGTEFRFRLPVLGPQSLGLNRFYLTLDARNDIEEQPAAAEFNNELVQSNGTLGVEVYIVSNDILPVHPPEFAIVGESNPILKASTLNAFAPEQIFRFQIDTTTNFNSPAFAQTTITAGGGMVNWEPNIPWENDRVYYWRVSPDSTGPEGYRWQQSSFLYQSGGEPGWNQSHYYQQLQDTFRFMQLPASRELAFIEDVIDVRIRNCIYEFPAQIPRYYIGGVSPASYQGGVPNAVPAGVFIAVLDSLTGDPIKNPGGSSWGEDFGPTNYRGFVFDTETTDDRAEVINFLENGVADNQYVIFFTVQKNLDADYMPEAWGADTISLSQSIYDLLESYGAAQVRQLENLGALPYSLFFRKGDPSSVAETIGNLTEVFDQTTTIEGSWFEGSLQSTYIGPAAEWTNLEWEISGFEPGTDSVSLNLIGIRPDGTDSLLHRGFSVFDTTLQHVDAAQFPRLQLEYFASDETFRTPPHLELWRVQYRPLPEAALDANARFDFRADTLQQGEPFSLEIGISNIGKYDMDSLLVQYRLLDMANEETIYTQRLAPLLSEDTLIASLELDTRAMTGPYTLTIDVNPDFDQPEFSRLNNVGLLPFRILRDEQEPLLDVTFDGVRIMNGDLVSADPEILVSVRDENPFLEMGDTSLINLLLLYPDGQLEQLHFNDPRITFYGADPGNLDKENKASIRFRPSFIQDGDYALFVEAADATGNQSGDLNYVAGETIAGYDYKIEFRVITRSAISNVLNYPNPFSTQTYFVYTLTGSEPPPRFKIQILTVSGRIVRELTQADLGMLQVGTHRTQFPWDGTDQFGDRLANGVYLYRVIAQKANGEAFEHYETNADGFFQKGFGKLVIIR